VLILIKTLGADGVFDPETIEILAGAFDATWRSVRASGVPLADKKCCEILRELLAKTIIEEARNGIRRQRELTNAALLRLAKTDLKTLRRSQS